MSDKFRHLSVSDFDKYDCVKISLLVYISLIFILRGYLIWLMSVTNMQDRVGIIQWVYPQTSLFYLNLLSGILGLFVLLVLSLRRPEAANWIVKIWPYTRYILIVALLFDMSVSIVGSWYLEELSFFWHIIHALVTLMLITLLIKDKRLTINLSEFPEKLPET